MEGSVSSDNFENNDEAQAEAGFTVVDQLTEVFERSSRQVASRDPRIVRIDGAVAEALRSEQSLREAAAFMIDVHEGSWDSGRDPKPLDNVHAQRWNISGATRPLAFPEYGANLFRRGLWHEWRLKKDELGWPDKFISAEVCRAGISRVIRDPESLDRFSANIAFRPVQSTVPARAAGPRLVIEANQDRFPDPINMVSVGHSLGYIEKKLLLNYPYSPIMVSEWYGAGDVMKDIPQHAQQLQRKLGRPVSFEKIIGIDILPGDKDEASRQWGLSCFTPGEQMNPQFMSEVSWLDSEHPANFISLQGDFSLQPDALEAAIMLEGQKADIVLFSTIWYQLTARDKSEMLKNALDILSPDGLIIVQDFAEARHFAYGSSDATNQLRFFRDWKRWTYRTLVLDPSRSGMEFQEAIYFIDGRCGNARFSEDYKRRLFGLV